MTEGHFLALAAEAGRLLLRHAADDADTVHLVLHGSADGSAGGRRMSPDLPVDRARVREISAALLSAVQDQAGRPDTTMWVGLTVRRDGTGDVVACWEDDLDDATGGVSRTLQPGIRPPTPANFSANQPGLPIPQVADDPTALRMHVRDVLPGLASVGEPARPDALADFERLIGAALPDEARAMYELADGGIPDRDRDTGGLYGGWQWLSLEEAGQVYRWTREHPWFGWDLGWDDARLETEPFGTVLRAAGHPGWVPLLHDGGGNYIGVDVAPAARGRIGQVLEFGRDLESATYLAPSLLSLLRSGPVAGRSTSSLLLRRPAFDTYADGRSIAETLTGLVAEHPLLQELRLFGLPPVDLGPLTELSRLRVLAIAEPGPDLSPLHQVPLESALLSGPDIDVSGLADHPTLSRIRLSRAHRVPLTPLATLPELRCVDLADSPGLDPRELGGVLDRLQYARLSAGQWDVLAQHGHPLPALAGMTVAGAGSLGEALRVAARFDRPGHPLRAKMLPPQPLVFGRPLTTPPTDPRAAGSRRAWRFPRPRRR